MRPLGSPGSRRLALSLGFFFGALALLLPSRPAHAAIGDLLVDARGHDFFRHFHLFEVARKPLMADGHVVVYQPPPLSRAALSVEVAVSTGPGDRLLEMELRIKRGFVDGPDRLHARDIARHMLLEAGPDLDRDDMVPFIAAFEGVGSMVGMVAPAIVTPQVLAAGPAQPSAPQPVEPQPKAPMVAPAVAAGVDADVLLDAFFHHTERYVVRTKWTRIVVENVTRADGEWVLLTVAALPSVLGSSVLPQPIPHGAGVTAHGVPVVEPIVLPAGPLAISPPQPDDIAGAVANVDPGLNLAGDPERTAYFATFLDDTDLPGMTRVRDTRLQGPTPADAFFVAQRGYAAGDALWLGTNHAAVWRVVDSRWVFPTPEEAAAYLTSTDTWHSEGLPRVEGLPTAGDEAFVHLGTVAGQFYATPLSTEVLMFRVGRVVCKLKAVQGPDSRQDLRAGTVALLADRIAARIRLTVAAVRPELEPTEMPAGPAAPPPPQH